MTILANVFATIQFAALIAAGVGLIIGALIGFILGDNHGRYRRPF